MTSNVVKYTIVLELYNFRRNTHHLQRIGQKIRTIFCLNFTSIVGCKHKSDYTLLSKQYPMFNLPPSKEIVHLMDDVSLMAINRAQVKKGRGQATLQALCRQQNLYLPKPQHVRVGSCFASINGSTSQEALRYCQLDVEAPLILHAIYSGLPDLTKRLTTETLNLGSIVDIMPSQGSSINPIVQGKIKQLGGVWTSNGVKLRKNQVR